MESIANLTVSSTKCFKDFGLAPAVIEALTRSGIEKPTPIQEKCISPILEGKDVVGKAETGTGKTVGFGAPIVSRIDANRVSPQALILTPTRELAQQVAGVLGELGANLGIKVALVVGGVHASEQILSLRAGAQIVVGTPGRVLEFLQDRTLSLVWCGFVVLDEADRMLDMGFIDDVTTILDKVPSERQTMLFSATLPQEVKDLLHRYMKDPEVYSTASGLTTVPDIRQTYIEAEFPRKFRELQKILDSYPDETVLIFCNTRRQAIDLDRMLWGHGYSAGALHGDHDQDVRFRVLEGFRSGDIKILVATDIASRGLDVDDVACVINYEIPDDPSVYVHRIGRTGRAKKSGAAVSIVAGKEWATWSRILKETAFPIERTGPERVRKREGGFTGRRPPRSDRGGSRGRSEGGRNASREGGGRRRREDGDPTRGGPRARGSDRLTGDTAGQHETDSMNRVGSVTDNDNSSMRSTGSTSGSSPSGSSPSGSSPSGSSPSGSSDRGASRANASDEDRQGSGAAKRRRRPRGRGRSRRPGADPSRPEESSGVEGRGSSGGDRPALTRSEGTGPRESSPAPASLERARQPRPERRRLDDLDDDFVKTDYFNVDHSIIERSSPPPKAGPSGPGAGRGEGRRSPARRDAERRGPAAREPSSAAGPGASGSDDSSSGGRRRRRRRPSKRGGRAGGASGSDAPSEAGAPSSTPSSPGGDGSIGGSGGS